jgi:hypothetical protein
LSRRGRRALGGEQWLARFEAIADAHARGLTTTEIQAEVGGRRSVISRVRALLRDAEARGCRPVREDERGR